MGAERECISDQGVVHQRILEWEPGRKLTFRMERTDLPSAKGIRQIEDSFDIQSTSGGVSVRRTTRVQVPADYSLLKTLELRIGLKQVHRYVFRNWQRLARESSRDSGGKAPAGRTAVDLRNPPELR